MSYKKDFNGSIIKCPSCSSANIINRGNKRKFIDGILYYDRNVSKFFCKDCGRWFMERTGEGENLEVANKYINDAEDKVAEKKVIPNMKIERNGDTIDIRTKDRPITLEEGLCFYDVDLSKYKVDSYRVNNWDMTNAAGNFFTNFQLKITLKPIKVKFETEYVIDKFKHYIDNFIHNKTISNKEKNVVKNSNNLLEINIADLHLGKYSNPKETGQSYNIEKSKRIFLECVKQLVNKGKKMGFDSVLLVLGSDYFNSDTMMNTTTKGTFQDEHEIWQARFDSGVELATESINYLAQVTDDLKVVIIPGNHDKQTSFYMGKVLEGLYKNTPFIQIYNTYNNRQYIKYGQNLIMLTHGDEIKIKDLPLLMATEKSEMWSNTKYREIQIGHLHTRKSYDFMNYEEHKGVLVKQLMSPTATDSWHKSKGFVGNIRGGEASLYNYDYGKICDIYHNIFETEMKIDEVDYDE